MQSKIRKQEVDQLIYNVRPHPSKPDLFCRRGSPSLFLIWNLNHYFITMSVYTGAFTQPAVFTGKAENWITILSLKTISKSIYNLNKVIQANRSDIHQFLSDQLYTLQKVLFSNCQSVINQVDNAWLKSLKEFGKRSFK